MAEAEGDFIHNLSLGRNRGSGGTHETQKRKGGYIRCCYPDAMSSENEQRDGNVSDFVSIIPPGVGNAVYQGVAIRGTGGGTEWGKGIVR